MNEDELFKAFLKALALSAAFLAMVCMLLALTGCQSVRYVPAVQTEYRDRYLHDSIHESETTADSTVIRRQDDTVFVDRWHTRWQTRWRETLRVDSFIRRDSIPVPVPVERRLSRWERFCIDYGKLTLGGTACTLLMGIGYLVRRLRHRR